MTRSRTVVAAGLFAVVCIAFAGFVAIGGASADSATNPALTPPDSDTELNVSEDAYVEEAPGPDDEYYEASDGNWVSYVNPRDEYREPYLGDGSAKICVTLLNEAGDPIVGETVPNTTVTLPTGDSTSWHSHADPMTVTYPLTENYDRPLDADQFGTTDDLPQGNGYMDSHCIELHGLPEDGTVEYGEIQIEGEHADKIETVGYIQQAHDTWDTDIDPIEAAEPYEEAGGSWTYYPDGSHGQVTAVLQLDSEVTGADGEPVPDEDDNSSTSSADETDDTDDEEGAGDELPGFGVSVALVALALAALVSAHRQRS
ncbi:PGF-CTERM sorting domain-containing protein [Natronorubrum aibiense]|uniref:PGF-CTERM sorting domain-containing protein n=1 Tax=Natronorubrum aibiense TaxID=348826 RepID=A0A5P9PA23_9EURY|nr:PGF-CTERM sorting domain-containing protein [Natronorubrum aibiense]QFU84991.1 PGF-CTERM sorting domain-containing protein [Natronorubrum aibiense]